MPSPSIIRGLTVAAAVALSTSGVALVGAGTAAAEPTPQTFPFTGAAQSFSPCDRMGFTCARIHRRVPA